MLSEGFHRRGIPLERIVGAVATNTASIHRLSGKGRIEIGYAADFCLIDLNREVKVNQSMMHDASDYSLFEGRTFKGWPAMTILGGKIVMENGEIQRKPGGGRFISSSSSNAPSGKLRQY
jgi:dihydroorotase-like cyclic amidohydrolase